MTQSLFKLFTLCVMVILTACGGSGGVSTPPATPVPVEPPTEEPEPTQGSIPSTFSTGTNIFYFSADDGVSGRELWSLSASGVQQIADLTDGNASTDFVWITEADGTIVTLTRDSAANSYILWQIRDTQSTPIFEHAFSGTITPPPAPVLINDRVVYRIGTDSEQLFVVDPLQQSVEALGTFNFEGNTWFRSGQRVFMAVDADNGPEVWSTDGTVAGTLRVDTSAISGDIHIYITNPAFLFIENGDRLWRVRANDLSVEPVHTFDHPILSRSPIDDGGFLLLTGESDARVFRVDPAGSIVQPLSARVSSVGSVSSGYVLDDSILYATNNMGEASLIHESLSNGAVDVITIDGDPICNQFFNVFKNQDSDQIFLKRSLAGNSVCEPFGDVFESYDPLSRTLQPMFEVTYSLEAPRIMLLDFAFQENGVYYLTGERDSLTRTVRHYSSVLGEDVVVAEDVLQASADASLIESSQGLLVVFDDGVKGLELWRLRNLDVELVADINQQPQS